MKKYYLMLLMATLSCSTLFGQICTIDTSFTEPGLYPVPDSLPCIVRDTQTDITVQFVNFDSATYQGLTIRVEYLIVDSITNLPCGIDWYTSKQGGSTPHRFENQEKGCIRFFGNTSDCSGQYKLEVYVRVKTNLAVTAIPVTASSVGFNVYVRVKDEVSAICTDIDTSSNAVNAREAVDECYYASCRVGINNITAISNFSFYPNPTNNTASVSFTAGKAATYTTRIINIYGAEVSRDVVNVSAGLNVTKLDVSSLANGVYIYTITDGKNVQTQRFVVEK